MSGLSTWYHRQYSTWGIRRLHTTPFLARTDTNTSRTATAMANQRPAADVVIDMGDLSENKHDKKHDTLFGPNIGIVSGGPNWAVSDDEKKATKDELTPEVVKSWVAKSKQAIQPTTTLQALVNLKRPTLKLSPLEMHPSDDPAHHESQHHHALEFEYDCDAPKCGIFVDVILTPEQRRSGNFGTKTSHVTIYESVFEGGFGKLLTLEDGAMLELGRFESNPHSTPSSPPDPVNSSTILDKLPSHNELPELHANSTDNSGTATPEHQPQERERRRRFTALHFRRRTQNRSVSGPALAVVDAEPIEGEKSPEEKSEQPEEGVRVLIRIVALDEDGKELAAANEQKTYLHVVRFGPVAAEGEEDTRPWVVKVVKREATIGVHTFHLHEIYGLSSASSSHPAPQNVPSPTSTQSHTYPPVAPPLPVDDEPSSECLLCLSSPREVVLLPCRHLVACKECAVNMVEFGAGGTITHSEPDPAPVVEPAPPAPQPVPENAPPATEGAAAEGEGAAHTDSPAPEGEATPPQPTPVAPIAPIAPVPPHPRRKRRPKGWFCPVCRQPYTSLLRITTSPPTDEDKLGKRTSTSTYHEHEVEPDLSLAPVTSAPSLPLPVDPIRGDRPSFIRGLALSSAV